MLAKDVIIAKICDILRVDLNWPVSDSELTDSSCLGTAGLGLDSVGIISLTVEMEEAFGISIPDEDVMEFADKTVGEAADYVQNSDASKA